MSYDVSKQFLWPGCRIRPLFYLPPPLWMRWRHIFIHFTKNAIQFRPGGNSNTKCNQDKSLVNKCTNNVMEIHRLKCFQHHWTCLNFHIDTLLSKLENLVPRCANDLYQLVHFRRLGKDFDAFAHLCLRKSAGKKRILHFFLCLGQLSPAGWQCVTEVSWWGGGGRICCHKNVSSGHKMPWAT